MALTDNLVGVWKLDEASGNALDSHGSNPFTLTGTASPATGRVYTTARGFTSAQHFRATDNATLSVDDEDFTVSVFAYLDDKNLDRRMLAHYDFGASQRSWALYYFKSLDRFRLLVSPDGVASTGVEADSLGSPSTGKWYHIVAWHVQGDGIYIRVNGGATDYVPHATGVHNSTADLAIGTLLNNGAAESSVRMNGRLSTFQFWKRVLTATEQEQLWMHRIGGKYPFPPQPPTVLMVGDTQNLTRTVASSDAWGQWIENTRVALNAKLVAHVGDHTEFLIAQPDADPGAFADHRASAELFLSDLIMTLVPGNHDNTGDHITTGPPTRDVTDMSDSLALPMSLITSKDEFDEQMDTSGYDQYVYSLMIDLGGNSPDVFIVLPFGPTDSQLDWAIAKAAQYPTRRVWIVIHDFLHSNATLYDNTPPPDYFGSDPDPYRTAADNPGTWYTKLDQIRNLVAVLCGHAFNNSSDDQLVNHTTIQGVNGNDVLAIIADAQERNGLGGTGDGNGQTVIIEVDGSDITAEQYFPVIDYFRKSAQDSFIETLESIPGPSSGSGYRTPGMSISLGFGI